MTFLKNKLFVFTLLLMLIIFIIGILGFGYFTYSKFSKINDVIISEINNGTKLSGNGVQKIINGYQAFKNNGNVEIVPTKYDLLKPKYSLVWDSSKISSETSTVTVQIIQLTRNNIFQDFQIDNYASAFVKNKSYNDVKTLAQKIDLGVTNPDSNNIKLEAPMTSEEVDRQKGSVRKEAEARKGFEYLDNLGNELQSKSLNEKLTFYKEYKSKLETAIQNQKQDPKAIIDFYGIECTPAKQQEAGNYCNFEYQLSLVNDFISQNTTK